MTKDAKIEICHDMECVIFNEVGQTLADTVRKLTDYTAVELGSRRKSGCIVEEQEERRTGERFYNVFIGRAWKESECDEYF